MLSASTRVRGDESARRRVASIPFSSGMATSITITSGCSVPASSTASRPLPASPTISMSGCAARIILNPCRTTAWSSANKIWIFSLMLRTARRHADFDLDALALFRMHRQVAAHAARAGTHPDHTHAAVPRASGRQAVALVVDRQAHIVTLRFQRDHRPVRAGMPRHISQGLLRQPEQVRFSLIRQPPRDVGLEFRLDARAMREAFAKPAQPGLQAEVVQNRRTQQLRHLAYIADGFVYQVQTVLQARSLRA